MGYEKAFVCLANSRKPPSGRCVAGKEVVDTGFGAWIRPVSARPSEEISEEERRYEDGKDPKVLDIVEVHMIEPKPRAHQTENHVIDDQYYWKKVGRADWDSVLGALDVIDGPLWVNAGSTWYGSNDKIPEEIANSLKSSLCLVRPQKIEILVAREGGDFGPPRRRVRATFDMNGIQYNLVVTDPVVERQYFERKDGRYSIEDTVFCISLSDAFHGYAYKLVAAVIEPPRGL